MLLMRVVSEISILLWWKTDKKPSRQKVGHRKEKKMKTVFKSESHTRDYGAFAYGRWTLPNDPAASQWSIYGWIKKLYYQEDKNGYNVNPGFNIKNMATLEAIQTLYPERKYNSVSEFERDWRRVSWENIEAALKLASVPLSTED